MQVEHGSPSSGEICICTAGIVGILPALHQVLGDMKDVTIGALSLGHTVVYGHAPPLMSLDMPPKTSTIKQDTTNKPRYDEFNQNTTNKEPNEPTRRGDKQLMDWGVVQ